jgi:hypothetical protein
MARPALVGFQIKGLVLGTRPSFSTAPPSVPGYRRHKRDQIVLNTTKDTDITLYKINNPMQNLLPSNFISQTESAFFPRAGGFLVAFTMINAVTPIRIGKRTINSTANNALN